MVPVQWRIQDFPEEGARTYDFAIFSQKLHEIKKIWDPRGGRASLAPPLRSFATAVIDGQPKITIQIRICTNFYLFVYSSNMIMCFDF